MLVNNAGIGGPDTDVTGTSLAEFRRVLDVNLTGTFLMCRAVAKVMIGQGSGGAIVNMGSVFGQQGVAGGAGYCASKAGVALLTHSLALELAPHGIRANTIAPGNMATEMHWDELRSRAARSGTAVRRAGGDGHARHPARPARHRATTSRAWWPGWSRPTPATSPARRSGSTVGSGSAGCPMHR